MAGFPEVRSCLGCCSTETGAKLIAWFQLITGILLFIYNVEDISEQLFSPAVRARFNIVEHVIMILLVLYPSLQATLLMIGIKKKKPGFLLAWLNIAIIVEFGLVICVIFFFASFFFIVEEFVAMASILFAGGILIGISFFFIVIVSTYRKDMIYKSSRFDYRALYNTQDGIHISNLNSNIGTSPIINSQSIVQTQNVTVT